MSLRVILSSKDNTRRDTRTRRTGKMCRYCFQGPPHWAVEHHAKLQAAAIAAANGPKTAQEATNATDEGEHQGIQPPSPQNGSGE